VSIVSTPPYQYLPPTVTEASIYCFKSSNATRPKYAPGNLTSWHRTYFELTYSKSVMTSPQSMLAVFIETRKSMLPGSYHARDKYFSFENLARLWINSQILDLFENHQYIKKFAPRSKSSILLDSWKTSYICEKTRDGSHLLTKKSEAVFSLEAANAPDLSAVVVVSQSAFKPVMED
jgi:hypothetical protein